MAVGRTFARGLKVNGIHGFLLHLPFYGERKKSGKKPSFEHYQILFRQGVSDARRARDAAAALPGGVLNVSADLGRFSFTSRANTRLLVSRGYREALRVLAAAKRRGIFEVASNVHTVGQA